MSDGSRYIFGDAGSQREWARLRALEAIFDPGTRRHLESTGDWGGRACLEVGAGAGSIAAWMASRAGPTGRVVAVDTDARFLEPLRGEVSVVEGDVRDAALGASPFGVAHARYVLIHNGDPGALIDAMVRPLAAGGWLLLEEPDFTVARPLAGPAEARDAWARVAEAVEETFRSRGMDPGLGRRLPSLVAERGLELVAVENDAPAVPGGAPLAELMRISAEQLREKYLATDRADERALARYRDFSADPSCWAVYYATLRVLARRGR